MRFLKSLFTDHLLAKLFAILFAAVTVYLVDRELTVEWYDESIVLVERPLEDQGENPRPYILIQKDSNVWVDRRGVERIRLKIEGPEKDLDIFLRDPQIVLKVRESWTRKDRPETTIHTLTDDDFTIPKLEHVEITVEPNIKLRVDQLAQKDKVPLELDLSDVKIPEGMKYIEDQNVFRPSTVRVVGPRHLVRELGGSDPARARLRVQTKVKALRDDVNYRYEVRPQQGYLDGGLRVLDVERLTVRVGLRPSDYRELKLPRKVVTLAIDYSTYEILDRDEVDFSIETIQMQKAWIILRGPASVVEDYRADEEKLTKLADSLRVVIDPSPVINEMTFGGAPPTQLPAQLVVLGGQLPDGLQLDRIEPSEISISAQKKP